MQVSQLIHKLKNANNRAGVDILSFCLALLLLLLFAYNISAGRIPPICGGDPYPTLGKSMVTDRITEDQGRTEAILYKEDIYTGLPWDHPTVVWQSNDGSLLIGYCVNKWRADEWTQHAYYLSRRPVGEKEWEIPVEMFNTGTEVPGDQSIFQPSGPDAPVFFSRDFEYFKLSYDNGKTWSQEYHCPPTNDPWFPGGAMRAFSRNPCLEMPNGDLYCATGKYPGGLNCGIVIIPPDNYSGQEPGGTPWSVLELFDDMTGINGSFLVQSPDYQKIAVVTRPRPDAPHLISRSTDGGNSWSSFENVNHGVGAAVGTASLDIAGGPAQGWHVISGAYDNRNGFGLYISEDTQNWQFGLAMKLNDGFEDG